MEENHTPAPWKVEADEEHVGKYPFHSYRFITAVDLRGRNVTICKMMDSEHMKADAALLHAAPGLLQAAKNALADLEGIMPEFEPSGDREHSGWESIKDLQKAIASATHSFASFEVVGWKDEDGDIVEASAEEADGFSVYATLKDGDTVVMDEFDVDYDTEELPAETETEWQERIVEEARQAAQDLAASLTKTYIEGV